MNSTDIGFTFPRARLCSFCNPPNSGEFGYAANQPLGVSPRFIPKPDANAFRLMAVLPGVAIGCSRESRPEQAAGELWLHTP